VGAAVATLSLGAVADRVTTKALLIGTSAILLAGPVALLSDLVPLAYAGFAAIGVVTGLYVITTGIAWARTYGVAGLGRVQGASFAAQITAAAAGPLPLAISLGATGSYRAGLLFLAAAAAVALLAAARWREPARR
jgi:hypothetical protein